MRTFAHHGALRSSKGVTVGDDDEAPHWEVEVGERFVRCNRTSRPYRTTEEMDEAYGQVVDRCAALDRHEAAILVDLREARGRNDPAFEQRLAVHRKAQFEGFRRAAVLVRSLVGKLQVERLMKEDGLDIPVFRDEDLALHYLRSEDE